MPAEPSSIPEPSSVVELGRTVAVRRAAIERWFIRRGVPHFIDDYSAGRDIFTRSIPALIVAYVLGGLTALDIYRWSAWRNVAVAFGILAMLLVAWAMANLIRRHPLLERPQRVGRSELAVFVLGPALPSLVFGQQWGDALQATCVGLAVLGVIYVTTSYALVPLLRWACVRLVGLLAALGGLVARALPLLLLIVTFSFLSAEVWEMAGTLPVAVYPLVVGLFVVAGVAFLASRLPSEIGMVGQFETWDEVRTLLAGTPAEACVLPCEGVPPPAGLSRRQWVNLALVSLFTQGVQITLVAVTMGAFLSLFGFFALPAATIANWTHQDHVDVWFGLAWGGRDLVVSTQLFQVAGFLAVFTGFYFTVVLVTDDTYRHEFRDDGVTELREALAVRCAYRHEMEAAATLGGRTDERRSRRR